MQINENYHRIENANMDILSSFEKKVWILLHEENKSPRTISNIFNTPLESTYQFINNIIAKLINNQETDVTDLELARMNRKLKIAEALKYARATGSNELLIMSEV